MIEFGLISFGDVTGDSRGALLSHAAVIRNVVREAILAENVGVSFFGVGEHHRADFAISAPEIVLAAIAGQTQRIKLGSAVTVLSTDDPIRVYQRIATLHAITEGRAEAILGRGAFKESFPLFGHDLAAYDALFDEKLELFSAILRSETVNWQGKYRASLIGQNVFPEVGRNAFTVWLGVGKTPMSVLRAANFNFPLMLGIIGGEPTRFRPFVDIYKAALVKLNRRFGRIGVHASGYVATTDARAIEEFWPHYRDMRNRHGQTLGWPPIERSIYEREVETGALFVGAPNTVAQKLLHTVKALEASRFDLKYSAGTLPHAKLCESIRLYGEQVIPIVRQGMG